MKKSIRRSLLINLWLAVAIMTCLAAVANYWLDNREIRRHLDRNMAQMARILQAMVADHPSVTDLKLLQAELSTSTPQEAAFWKRINAQLIKEYNLHYASRVQFQILDRKGHVLLHTRGAPLVYIPNQPEGFTEQAVNRQTWRIFSVVDPYTGWRFEVWQLFDVRTELAKHIAKQSITIILMTYPILAILVWLVVSWGLLPLNRLTHILAQQQPEQLLALNANNVPQEINPLVQELNQLFIRFRQGLARENRFAADAAHELRTPLAALKAQVQVALKTEDADQKQHALKQMSLAVDRTAHIVEQLLAFARIMPMHLLQQPELLNLVSESREILSLLTPAALEKKIDIEFVADADHYPLLGYPVAIQMLIRNLVDNAIRYTPMHGQVIVHVYRVAPKTVRLSVQDSGPGIPSINHERVFERFYRGPQAHHISGCGLGLPIVKQIVDLHHATVTLGASLMGGLQVDVNFEG